MRIGTVRESALSWHRGRLETGTPPIRLWSSWFLAHLLTLVLLCFTLPSPSVIGAELSSQQLKALYLFNFAKFTKWTAKQSKAADNKITIGFVGQIDFEDKLPLIDGKTFSKKSVAVKKFDTVQSAIETCQILFIGETAEGISDMIDAAQGTSILTVSESKNFARRGGMVEMYLHENIQGKQRLVFDVNLSSLKKEGLTLNSRVLKLANKRIR